MFLDTLHKFKCYKASITLSNDAVPKVCKPWPIPYTLQPTVGNEISRLVKEWFLKLVDPAITGISLASPIVVVVKVDGCFSICGDFKLTC